MPRHLDIEAVKAAVAKYERIAGAKVNFDKKRRFCGSVLGRVSIPGQDPAASSGCRSGPTSNWSEIGRR